MGRTSIRNRVKSGSSTGRSGGFWPGAFVRAGLYARVPTHDQQTLPMQLSAKRDYVAKRRWKIALEIQDVGSGASLRPNREELLKAARRWEVDRWERSLLDLISILQELASVKSMSASSR
jgi:putative DNA-invertase from lambdoid prophage Rac